MLGRHGGDVELVRVCLSVCVRVCLSVCVPAFDPVCVTSSVGETERVWLVGRQGPSLSPRCTITVIQFSSMSPGRWDSLPVGEVCACV